MLSNGGGSANRVGRYEVIGPLARGGMAEILLARSSGVEGFERTVVLKRILPQLAHEHEFVRMFLDEARIAATLHHPNIVQVLDVLATDDSYVIAMEYLHGADLGRVVRAAAQRGEQIPLELVLLIISEVCGGLHYAHERTADGRPLDIVHRDVSPQNIIVTYEGAVKLVDFGIAKATQRLNETLHSTLKGKLSYMSPEQVRARPIDRRSDVFSLCVVLWELLASRRLYAGASEYDILRQIVERDAPLPERELPPELVAILRKGLARDRDDRFSTALELQLALESFATTRGLVVTSRRLAVYLRELLGEPAEPLALNTGVTVTVLPATEEWSRPPSAAPSELLHARTETLAPSELDRTSPRRGVRAVVTAAAVIALVALVGYLVAGGRSQGEHPVAEPAHVAPAPSPAPSSRAESAAAASPVTAATPAPATPPTESASPAASASSSARGQTPATADAGRRRVGTKRTRAPEGHATTQREPAPARETSKRPTREPKAAHEARTRADERDALAPIDERDQLIPTSR